MDKKFVTDRARCMRRKFNEVYQSMLSTNRRGMDLDTMELYNRALMESIDQIQPILTHNSVRCHLDPKLLIPDVNERSATMKILLRLQNQVFAVCTLADMTDIGNEANHREQEAMSTVQDVLERLYEMVTNNRCFVND